MIQPRFTEQSESVTRPPELPELGGVSARAQAQQIARYLAANTSLLGETEQRGRFLLRTSQYQIELGMPDQGRESLRAAMKSTLGPEERVRAIVSYSDLGSHSEAQNLLRDMGSWSKTHKSEVRLLSGFTVRKVVAAQRKLGDAEGALATLKNQLKDAVDARTPFVDTYIVSELVALGFGNEVDALIKTPIADALEAGLPNLDLRMAVPGLRFSGAVRLLAAQGKIDEALVASGQRGPLLQTLALYDWLHDSNLTISDSNRKRILAQLLAAGLAAPIERAGDDRTALSMQTLRSLVAEMTFVDDKDSAYQLGRRLPDPDFRERVLVAVKRGTPIPTLSGLPAGGLRRMPSAMPFIMEPVADWSMNAQQVHRRSAALLKLTGTPQTTELERLERDVLRERRPAIKVVGLAELAVLHKRLKHGPKTQECLNAALAINQSARTLEQQARLRIPIAVAQYRIDRPAEYESSLKMLYDLASQMNGAEMRPESVLYRLAVEQAQAGDIVGAANTAMQLKQNTTCYRTLLATLEESRPFWETSE